MSIKTSTQRHLLLPNKLQTNNQAFGITIYARVGGLPVLFIYLLEASVHRVTS